MSSVQSVDDKEAQLKRIPAIATFSFLLLAALACDLGTNTEATAQALSRSLNETATALASTAVAPELMVETAQAQATAVALGSTATHSALSVEQGTAQAATATFIAPMINDLPTYGLDPSQGRVGWMHPPLTLDIKGFHQYQWDTNFKGTVARDFAVSADITWTTTTGLSGCGFAFRADDKGNQYIAFATRGADGHVIFATMKDNDVKTHKDYYAAVPIDPSNGATNRFTVVGKGSFFTFYINGVQVGTVDAYAKTGDAVGLNYEAGFVAMLGLSESGRTICEFNNAWLWLTN